MKLLVNFFPEITLKSRAVRKQFTSTLRRNIATAINTVYRGLHVSNEWDRIIISGDSLDDATKALVFEKLQKIPGIDYFTEVVEHPFESLEDIGNVAFELFKDQLPGKSLCVRVKRVKSNTFRALDAEREIGGMLIEKSPTTTVNLRNPDVLVRIKTNVRKFEVEKGRVRGIGGYPIGCQEKVLSLISGGFDSGVSSYLMMKKGCHVDYLFFNLGGRAHELGVKEVSKYLSTNFSDGYDGHFITVDFEPIVAELLENVHHKYRGVILKRLMMMIGSRIAESNHHVGIVTGESTGQVSSQTLVNLNVITKAAETLVLRPLLTMDKIDIIRIAQAIGTEDFAKNMPEYCGVVSDRPATAAKLDKVLAEETKFNFDLVQDAIDRRVSIKIKNYQPGEEEMQGVEQCSFVHKHEVVIDVRDEEKRLKSSLELSTEAEIIQIPFYKLNTRFKDLDQNKTYLLYCDKGVVSKLLAVNIKDQGFDNIKVLRPLIKGCELKSS